MRIYLFFSALHNVVVAFFSYISQQYNLLSAHNKKFIATFKIKIHVNSTKYLLEFTQYFLTK